MNASEPEKTTQVTNLAPLAIPPLLVNLVGWVWRLVLLGIAAWLLLKVAQRLYLVSIPLAVALLLTALLSPAVFWLRRRGLPRALATTITVLAALAAVAAVMTWVVVRAVGQFPQLVDHLSSSVRRLPISNSTLTHWRNELVHVLQSNRGALTSRVISSLSTVTEVVVGLVVALLLTLILLTDGDRIWGWLVHRLPPAAGSQVLDAGHHAYYRLSGWVRGTFLIALFHAAVMAVTLLALGVPLIAPLSILVFFGSFIPIVGSLVFGGVAVLVTFASSGPVAVIVLVVVLLVDNQFEAHVLQPFLVGRYVRLHPFVVVLVLPAGALLGGLVGTILVVPLTASVYAFVQHLHPIDGSTDRQTGERGRIARGQAHASAPETSQSAERSAHQDTRDHDGPSREG